MTRTDIGERCTIEVHLTEADLAEALRRDARAGLTATPKHLPPKWFYDERGSQLFDDITRLPEYYPTRKETEILERESGAIARRTGATSLVELGSGTSTKTKLLLDGLADAGTLERFVPFDVCEPVLVDAAPRAGGRGTPASASTRWSATSSSTSAGSRWRAPRWSPSSAAPSATSCPRPGPSSSRSSPTRWPRATGSSSAPTS